MCVCVQVCECVSLAHCVGEMDAVERLDRPRALCIIIKQNIMKIVFGNLYK